MRRRALASACTATALGLVLTACGGDSTEAANDSVSLAGSESTTTPPAAGSSSATSSAEASSPAGRTTADTATPQPGTPPADRVKPGAIVSGEGFLRPGSGTDYQFTAGGGKWKCVVTQTVAGCAGELAPGVPARSDGVAVTAEGKSGFAIGTAEDFAPSGAAKELPPGRTLPNGTFVCTAFQDGIQCETASGAAGFKLSEKESVNW